MNRVAVLALGADPKIRVAIVVIASLILGLASLCLVVGRGVSYQAKINLASALHQPLGQD